MCNATGPLTADFSSKDNPVFGALRDELMAENPAIAPFLQANEEGELAQQGQRFDGTLAQFGGVAALEPAPNGCQASSLVQQLLQRI
jgi:hypothetical protein